MKIVVIPGVGFNEAEEEYNNFRFKLADAIDQECEIEIFYWKHSGTLPDVTLPWKPVRSWVYEVILDFQQVVQHSFDMEVPEADYYIGHSAGSIISLVQEKPCITMGSPAVLIECLHSGTTKGIDTSEHTKLFEAIHSDRSAFNLVNSYDQLAYPIDDPHVENYIFKGPWWNLNRFNPYSAHSGYWSNKKIIKKIAGKIVEWEAAKSV